LEGSSDIRCMTGPAYGKLKLEGAKIFVGTKEIEGEVYIHVKGFALARVTHLDIEAKELEKFINGKGEFLSIRGLKDGIEIKTSKGWKIKIFHKLLNKVLEKGEGTRTWVGKKEGGIYIGFRKEQVRRLEKIAKEDFKFNF